MCYTTMSQCVRVWNVTNSLALLICLWSFRDKNCSLVPCAIGLHTYMYQRSLTVIPRKSEVLRCWNILSATTELGYWNWSNVNVSPLERSESSLAAMLRELSSPSSVRNSEITHNMDDVLLTDEQWNSTIQSKVYSHSPEPQIAPGPLWVLPACLPSICT